MTTSCQPPVLLMATDATVAVTALGSAPGWVSGSPASLAASGVVDCIFDLGPNWDQYPVAQISFIPSGSSSGCSLQATGSDTAAINLGRRLNIIGATTIGTGIVTYTTSPQAYCVRPMGRILVVRVTNTDGANAQGSTSKVTVAAYPG